MMSRGNSFDLWSHTMCIHKQLRHRALGALALTLSLALSLATALAASTVATGGAGGHANTLLA